jgi:hypothetical protein
MARIPIVNPDSGKSTSLWYSNRDGGSVRHEDVYQTDRNGNTQTTNLHYDPKTGTLHPKS